MVCSSLTAAELSAVRLVAQAAERVILNGGVRQNETGQYYRTTSNIRVCDCLQLDSVAS